MTSGTDVFDFENRLILRQKPDGTSINLAYDADGIRIGKTFFDSTGTLQRSTGYLIDTNNLTGYAQVVEEATSSSLPGTSSLKTYCYGSDLISRLELTANSSQLTAFYLYDGFASVRALSDETGTLTDRYTYDAFGLLIAKTGTTENAHLYRSEQWDADLGLYYNRARYLNPDSGRFWSMDSFEGFRRDPRSLHRILYGNANPIFYCDPTGRFSDVSLPALGAATGLIVTLAYLALPNVRQQFGSGANPTGSGRFLSKSGLKLRAVSRKWVNGEETQDPVRGGDVPCGKPRELSA